MNSAGLKWKKNCAIKNRVFVGNLDSDPIMQHENPPKITQINDSVKPSNYDQIIRFVQRQWNQVKEESKEGTVHYF